MKRFAEAVRLLSGAGFFAAAAMGATVAGSDHALAQGVPAGTTAPGCTSTFPAALGAIAGGQSQIIGGVVGVTNSVSSVIGTMNTAFLSQGNAFVAGLPNPTPDETSGGIGSYDWRAGR